MCHGNIDQDTKCTRGQYMVVKTASYRGLSDTKTCGSLSDEYNCEMDVTCLVKKQCDGQHECSITVGNKLVSSDLCPGLTKYFYLEHRCADHAISFSDSNVSFCSSGGPRILTNMSSSHIKAKIGDLVNLLCSAQGEPPIFFSWTKDKRTLESFTLKKKPHPSSLLVVTIEDEANFGKYVCHIRDRFQTIAHTISVGKLEDKISKENLIVIIVLAILLVISLVFLVYFICQNRRQKPPYKQENLNHKHVTNNLKVSNDNSINTGDGNYEQVELNDEQSTYTALKRSRDEENDDKLYTHLIIEPQGYLNEEKTAQDYVIQEKI